MNNITKIGLIIIILAIAVATTAASVDSLNTQYSDTHHSWLASTKINPYGNTTGFYPFAAALFAGGFAVEVVGILKKDV